ncbi:hypothetical protein HMI54_007819 [Coelomomyces lativittatus]|nr:hypothetical protein HMI54_007819 [Coelomomyces lativittatus]KAJ1508149.1 hypothetical protein HMI56_007431 [Coelomomyces lativittatus]KAJ1518137.1 hypothetical protein HMI55_002556 [Coelomomyces lativittatus]
MNPVCGTLLIKLFSARNDIERLKSEETRLLAILKELKLDSGLELCEFDFPFNECLHLGIQTYTPSPINPKRNVGLNTTLECLNMESPKICQNKQAMEPCKMKLQKAEKTGFMTNILKKAKKLFQQRNRHFRF